MLIVDPFVSFPPPSNPLAPGFFVATNGSDSNPGTLALPFLTLEAAQTAMRNSATIKTTYLRAGTYNRTTQFVMTSADNGTTVRYYPPDGVNTAVINAGGSGVDTALQINGTTNVTINGLKVTNFGRMGIGLQGGASLSLPVASGNTFINNDCGNNVTSNSTSGGIYCFGACPNTTIKNNYIHDTISMGIGLNTHSSSSESIAGSVIANNVVLRTVQNLSDGGGIYVSMAGGFQAPANAVLVQNNYVKDYGSSTDSSAHGLYCDDSANNVLLSGNIVGPPAGEQASPPQASHSCFISHNGHDNHCTGNIFDLGSLGRVFTVTWAQDSSAIGPLTGQTFSGNIVISSYTGVQNNFWFGVSTPDAYFQSTTAVAISNNVYKNYSTGTINTSGSVSSDASPIFEDPQLSGYTYLIAAGSPVFNSPVNFVPIVGGWGPPGFVIPQTGSVPSCPH